MFTTTHPVLADHILTPGDAHAIMNFIGGLTGAALVAAVVGGLIGYAVALKIDWLPAAIGIGLGMGGMFVILNIPIVPQT